MLRDHCPGIEFNDNRSGPGPQRPHPRRGPGTGRCRKRGGSDAARAADVEALHSSLAGSRRIQSTDPLVPVTGNLHRRTSCCAGYHWSWACFAGVSWMQRFRNRLQMVIRPWTRVIQMNSSVPRRRMRWLHFEGGTRLSNAVSGRMVHGGQTFCRLTQMAAFPVLEAATKTAGHVEEE